MWSSDLIQMAKHSWWHSVLIYNSIFKPSKDFNHFFQGWKLPLLLFLAFFLPFLALKRVVKTLSWLKNRIKDQYRLSSGMLCHLNEVWSLHTDQEIKILSIINHGKNTLYFDYATLINPVGKIQNWISRRIPIRFFWFW